MKRNKLLLLCTALIFCGWVQASATTLDQIAGTYEGWRTETTAAGTIRYQEMDEILTDGSFYTWLVDPNGIVYTMYSVLTINADGTIGGPYAGILEIHGRHLSIHVRSELGSVQVSTRRTD
jgi:protein involved in polysaccharide export with SLBB domain